MHGPRSFPALVRLMVLGLMLGLVSACGGTASASSAGITAAPSIDPGGATETDDGDGTSAGDRMKGSAQVQVTGGLAETVDLPFAAVLALWESNGPRSAYLPFTDEDAVLFMTFAADQLLVQYARTSTGVGLTSGATPCTFSTEVLDASNARGSFSCPGMTLIQGETVGSADMNGTFEAQK